VILNGSQPQNLTKTTTSVKNMTPKKTIYLKMILPKGSYISGMIVGRGTPKAVTIKVILG
jgi:hypothetical protein